MTAMGTPHQLAILGHSLSLLVYFCYFGNLCTIPLKQTQFSNSIAKYTYDRTPTTVRQMIATLCHFAAGQGMSQTLWGELESSLQQHPIGQC